MSWRSGPFDFPTIYGPHVNKREKTQSSTYGTDREDEVSKRFIFEKIHEMFVCPMDIIPKVRNKKRKIKIKKCTKVSLKQFGANGVSLHVKRRLDALYVQHLVD